MRRFSVRATAVAAALCITAASAGAAGAQSTSSVVNTVTRPLGTTTASKSLLELHVGQVLGVEVLPDKLVSSIDDVKSTKKAESSLCLASLTSAIGPVNEIGKSLPCFKASHDGQQKVQGSALDLSTQSLPLPLVSAGSIDIKAVEHLLGAALKAEGATASVVDNLVKIDVAKLVQVNLIKDDVLGNALVAQADGKRSFKVEGDIDVLKLGDLLGLGAADLNGLPLPVLNDLVKLLKLPVQLPGGETDVVKAVNGLLASIDTITKIQTTDASVSDKLTKDVAPVANTVNSLTGAISVLPVTKTQTLPTPNLLNLQVGDTLAGLQSSLTNVLNGLLGTVHKAANTPLVRIKGFTLDASTLAVANLADSKALADVNLGAVEVLGTKLVDLQQVKGLVDTLNGILANLVGIKLELLEETAKVQSANGYNVADAVASVLHLNVNPLGLFGGNGGLLGGLTATSAARTAGVNPASLAPAALPTNLLGLLSAPGGGLLDLRVAPVRSHSEFKAAAPATPPAPPAAPVNPVTPTEVKELPRTGAETNVFAAAAVILMLLSIGIRRSLRRAEVVSK